MESDRPMDAAAKPDIRKAFAISESACALTVRAMSLLESRLNIHINLHDPENRLESGQIYLFNHFARFETFIPQYLIHKRTGAFVRSIAAREFFAKESMLSDYLLSLGAVPNDYPLLLPFLAAEILRGRKVVIFPEGGMVKDRRVLYRKDQYRVYSRVAKKLRKHHAGAAVLGLTLDAFKTGLVELEKTGKRDHLKRWADILGIESVEALLREARRPTEIIPSNITFYPIRVGDNLVLKAAELFNAGLPQRFVEELRIEGNLLLKDTDMDIRLGEPVKKGQSWNWLERKTFVYFLENVNSMEEFFRREVGQGTPADRFLRICIERRVSPARDAYMREMYANLTVNLSHMAARLIMRLLDMKKTRIEKEIFHKILYLAIKQMQKRPDVHLHHSLLNPSDYGCILYGECQGLGEFMQLSMKAGLIASDETSYSFLPKLCEEHDIDQVRIENPVIVYANEGAPIPATAEAVKAAIKQVGHLNRQQWAEEMFEDERLSLAWEKKRFSDPRYDAINEQETATESPEPYLLIPKKSNGLGVVLVHGFLASPAELREFGQRLYEDGHPVIGVRLNGHGTSPWDLRGRTWQNWMEPVRRGYRILSAYADRIALVGFSSGGAMSLILASEKPRNLAGVVAVSTPMKFMNKKMIFVPLIQRANEIARWIPSLEGVMPFRVNESEHPHINYRNMSIRGLFELRRMVEELNRRLPKIDCPVTLIQGDADRVVDPKSLAILYRRLTTKEKTVKLVPSTRHGILNENIAGTQEIVREALAALRPHAEEERATGTYS